MSELTFLHEHATVLPVDSAALREHESQAWAITYYAPSLLPDVLWHPQYARAVWEGNPNVPNESIPERLAVLRNRQNLLFREGGPHICVYTTVEALLSEAVNFSRAMTQRAHQVNLLCERGVKLMFRIVAAGRPPADRFTLFEGGERGTMIYVPGTVTELFLTTPSHVNAHQELFNEFDIVAWNAHDSRTFLAELTARNPLDVETQPQAAALAASFGFTETA